MAEGYKQANIVILHKGLADDFEKFCHANSGPLPLLYRSQPGEWKCTILTDNSDIRTDCPQYCKFQCGNFTGYKSDLLEYTKEMEDMTTFYLGCSFAFEQAILKAGVPIRNVEQKRNVSMYKSHRFLPSSHTNRSPPSWEEEFCIVEIRVGIGEGGNDLGMGKVKEAVRKCMPRGELVACDVGDDFAVTVGVSNWGGYAVACALYILNCCPIHDRYLRKAVGFPRHSEQDSWASALPTVTKEKKLLELLVKYGIQSGKTGNLGIEVKGLPFYDTHSAMIQQLAEITL
ncbi:UNVERIFIED_CONTAM: hypothetical protein FKN15_078273 [Acipenser sinensis]